MKTQMLKPATGAGHMTWVLPNPVWNALVLGTRSVLQVYTLCNHSTKPVTIQSVNLVRGDDSRLNVIGGTCVAGLVLAPNATCTIDVEATPKALGTVKQALCVYHSADASPLWIEIAFAVVRRANARRPSSILAEDTVSMERQRRLREQEGHRRYARVNAREHPEASATQPGMAAEGEMQNNILQNPWLNSQRFDGIDPNLNPEPPLNSEARREFDNQRREQEMEKQLRLGNMPKFKSAPKPQGF